MHRHHWMVSALLILFSFSDILIKQQGKTSEKYVLRLKTLDEKDMYGKFREGKKILLTPISFV